MRLFLKHILRSIKKAPLQPLIIILTLTIAVATIITATELSETVINDLSYKKTARDSSSDITVRLSKSDKVRILFKDEAERIVADNGSVMGEFHLTALTDCENESSLVSIVATELERADDFYSLGLKNDASITKKELNSSVILSEKTANRLGLKVGDIFSVSLLNHKLDFTVISIAESDGILMKNDAIVNIGAVIEAISGANPSVAIFADSVLPFTELKIKLNEESEVDKYVALLGQDPAFSGKEIVKASDDEIHQLNFDSTVTLVTTLVITVIIILVSSIVITSALDLLTKGRMQDMALFMLSGAHGKTLNKILYLECLIYSFSSAVLGVLLSIPMIKGLANIYTFGVYTPSSSALDAIIAIISAPAVILLIAFINTRKEEHLTISERLDGTAKKAGSSLGCNLYLTFLALCALFFTVTLFVGPKHRYIFGLPSALFFCSFVFAFTPFFSVSLFRLISSLVGRRKNPAPLLLTASENMTTSYPLRHTARLITVLVTLMSTLFFCIDVLITQTYSIVEIVDSEYVVLGADDRTTDVADGMSGVNESYHIFFSRSVTTEDGVTLVSISGSENALEHINENFRPERLPKGNEIILAQSIIALTGKNVGDQITLKYDNNSYTFNIIDAVSASCEIVFLDAEAIGEKNDILCIDAAFANDSEEFAALSEAMSLRGASLTTRDALILSKLTNSVLFSNMSEYISMMAVLTMMIGILNVLFSGYLSRKREKEVYYTVGMTRGMVLRTGIYEILSAFAVAAILAPISAAILTFLLDFSLISFGIDLIPI